MVSATVSAMPLPSSFFPQSLEQIRAHIGQVPQEAAHPFETARQRKACAQELDLTPEALGFDPVAEQIPLALECAYDAYRFRDLEGRLRRVESIGELIEAGLMVVCEDLSGDGLDPFS